MKSSRYCFTRKLTCDEKNKFLANFFDIMTLKQVIQASLWQSISLTCELNLGDALIIIIIHCYSVENFSCYIHTQGVLLTLKFNHNFSSRDHNVTFVSAFPADFHLPGLEEVTPAGLVFYVRNYTNWDLVGARLKGEEALTPQKIFRYPYEVVKCSSVQDFRYKIQPPFSLCIKCNDYLCSKAFSQIFFN